MNYIKGGADMVRPEKKEAVAEIKDKINQSKSMVIADYLGLDVAEMTELRSQLRDQGVEFRVVKNTLASIAADESDMEEMKEFFNWTNCYCIWNGRCCFTGKSIS